jgi:hypothetical protein
MPYLVVTVVMRALCHNNLRRNNLGAQPLAGPEPGVSQPGARSRLSAVTDENALTGENAATGNGATTDDNDWRVTVRLGAGDQAGKAAEHLSAHQVEGEVHKRLGGRVVVGTSGKDELFLYVHTRDAAAAAQQSVRDLLSGHGLDADYTVERWHPLAEEWEAADVPLPATPAEIQAERKSLDAAETSQSVTGGVALFEVRVQLPSHRESVALAARLVAEGYSVVRRWRFLVVGANNEEQVAEFAGRIRDEAPADAVISTEEVGPGRPYTVWELAAGSGL